MKVYALPNGHILVDLESQLLIDFDSEVIKQYGNQTDSERLRDYLLRDEPLWWGTFYVSGYLKQATTKGRLCLKVFMNPTMPDEGQEIRQCQKLQLEVIRSKEVSEWTKSKPAWENPRNFIFAVPYYVNSQHESFAISIIDPKSVEEEAQQLLDEIG